MEECIGLLVKGIIFSMLDTNRGYWQIEIDDADEDTTAYKFHHDLYCFVYMTFGFHNARGTF